MSTQVLIKEVPLETVWRLRREVLYPERPIEGNMLTDDPVGMHWGVYLDNEPVSVISLFKEGPVCRFRKFATRAAFQGKGYGSLLLGHIMELAGTLDGQSIWCNARTTARGLYERFGMKAVGKPWAESGYTYVKMEKQFKVQRMEIIPAIDIIDGKCVRLTQGDYSQKKIYNEHPLEVAMAFEDAGLRRLHLVDLDGAKAGKVKNWKVLEALAGKTSLVIDFGGGIKTAEDVDIVFDSGAALATIGSIAVKDGALFVGWLEQYGAEKFLLGADVKDEKIAVSGWLETTDRWVYDFIGDYVEKGVRQVFCTDVSKDGLLQGPALELYKNIVGKFPDLHFIASGGVSGMDDVRRLAEIGCKGVIIGKAIYEGLITLNEITELC
jgi:phosphoribosylformimino-5-aminoimidazole carboxamide ribotide isomerase